MKTRVPPLLPPANLPTCQPALPTSFWMCTLTVTSTLCPRYKHRENKLPSNSSSPAPLPPALLQPLPPYPPPTPLFFLPTPSAPHGGLASVDLLWISQECGFIRGASNALFVSKVARRASIETCCEPAAQKNTKKQKRKSKPDA